MKFKFTTKILFVAVILISVFVFFPTFNITGLDSIFNAVTFIFGVLYGFEISIVLGNFTSLKTSLAQLNAQLRAIYSAIKVVSPEAAEFAGDKIEAYLMKSIDLDLTDQNKTEKEFTEFMEMGSSKLIKDATLADADAQGVRIQFVYQGFYDVANTRNQIEQVAPKFIELPEWLMLFSLSIILIVILFLQRTDLITSITSGILATMIIGALILLDDIDSNDLQEGFLEYEIFNTTLSEIGRKKYYPEFAINEGRISHPKNNYRVGVFPNYPDLDKRVVKEVK